VSKVFIDFLNRLHKQVGGRVVVILDSHPVHKSAYVRRWMKGTNGEMELYFLPGYSPELNPDEYLNNDVKTNAQGTERPRNQTEMIQT
jgi:transposase